MTGGRWWGTLFFLFMVFAALSTVLGVCENILAMVRELTGLSRPKGALLCGVGIFLLALTTALGYSVLHFQPFAAGTAWLDLWDFIVSNNILPLGSLVLALFCCNSFGWGWDAFVQEANTGKGLKVQPWMKPIFRFVVPAAIAFIYIYGMQLLHGIDPPVFYKILSFPGRQCGGVPSFCLLLFVQFGGNTKISV